MYGVNRNSYFCEFLSSKPDDRIYWKFQNIFIRTRCIDPEIFEKFCRQVLKEKIYKKNNQSFSVLIVKYMEWFIDFANLFSQEPENRICWKFENVFIGIDYIDPEIFKKFCHQVSRKKIYRNAFNHSVYYIFFVNFFSRAWLQNFLKISESVHNALVNTISKFQLCRIYGSQDTAS
jgi:hypothetical protein